MTLDTEQGLRNVAGNQTLYRKVLQRFVETHGHTVDEIEAALQKDDLESAERAAHTVKGLAATLGTVEYAQATQAVDAALKSNQHCQELLDAMRQAETAALAEIAAYLA